MKNQIILDLFEILLIKDNGNLEKGNLEWWSEHIINKVAKDTLNTVSDSLEHEQELIKKWEKNR